VYTGTVASVHLVCGSTGAGKTTYAKALAERARGVRFSIDDWMATLFWRDAPPAASLDWALERISRCEEQMLAIAEQLVARGVDVVLDLGLSRREHRDRLRFRSLALGAEVKMHYLDVDRDTRRARVQRRNTERTGTYAFHVSDEMFDFMEGYFEPPSDDELYDAMIVCESEAPGAGMLF
jgi:predicted kinase